MINDSFLTQFFSWFGQIYAFGDSLILISLGGVQVSLNNFLLVLAVMGIVLGALLNFAKVHGADIAERGYTISSSKRRAMYRDSIRDEHEYEQAAFAARRQFINKYNPRMSAREYWFGH